MKQIKIKDKKTANLRVIIAKRKIVFLSLKNENYYINSSKLAYHTKVNLINYLE